MKKGDQNSEIGRIAIAIIHFMWKKRDYDLSFYFVNLLFRPNEGKCLGILRWTIRKTSIRNRLYNVQIENVSFRQVSGKLWSKFQGSGFSFQFLKNYHNLTTF